MMADKMNEMRERVTPDVQLGENEMNVLLGRLEAVLQEAEPINIPAAANQDVVDPDAVDRMLNDFEFGNDAVDVATVDDILAEINRDDNFGLRR